MDFSSLLGLVETPILSVQQWWQALPYALQHDIWLGMGVALFTLFGVAAYFAFRRLLGHRKFRGAWYSEDEMHVLVDTLLREQKESNRVLHHDEIRLVRRAVHGPGFKPLFDDRHGGYI